MERYTEGFIGLGTVVLAVSGYFLKWSCDGGFVGVQWVRSRSSINVRKRVHYSSPLGR